MSKYDVVIIGGGPAGLAAGAYARHAGLKALIIAKHRRGKVALTFSLRGQSAVNTVLGADLVEQLEQQVLAEPSVYSNQTVKKITHDGDTFSLELTEGDPIFSRSVIVNTGARAKRLFVPGENRLWLKGVSYSAISHASLFADRDVAVVGNGDRAVIAALELAPLVRNLHLIAYRRRGAPPLRAADQIRNYSNVSVFWDWEVQQILGEEYVTGISLVGANGETRQLPVDGVFVQFELLPNVELVRGLVELDVQGHICVNHRCETSVPGLFAAGDVTSVYAEQVPVAIGEGVKAMLSAWEFLATHN